MKELLLLVSNNPRKCITGSGVAASVRPVPENEVAVEDTGEVLRRLLWLQDPGLLRLGIPLQRLPKVVADLVQEAEVLGRSHQPSLLHVA